MQNIFLFTFSHERDKDRVLDGIPWLINNALIVLKQWLPNLKLAEVDFSSSPFWVQVHGLPINQMTTQNARLIGNLFKNLLDIDMASNDDVSIGSCIRLRVEVDITKPMLEGFTNKRPDGSLERVRFRFERLPDLCYMCGLLDHQIQTCSNISRVTSVENQGKRQEYGPWMRAEIFSSKSRS
ncbi:hypothetical protein P3X46_030034 [Hevea brasiliensis]|uniref:DUF4283 domain-containing protein n=1 Tax=Hevea brasiliensis TaxID=3981 RepID=A0ABQ9KUI5_HEVBR|nr:hypothetical protein P3X46_030034 [Hevea brasiliensis]